MEQVKVALRVRPLLPTERERGEDEKISVLPGGKSVQVVARVNRTTQNQVHTFDMDCCLGPDENQRELFAKLGIAEMCDAVFKGRAATVMCFGQTGSGKTYTISGHNEGKGSEQLTGDGIQLTAARYMAATRDELMAVNNDVSTTITLRVSYLELFNERINDLLNGTEGLKCRWSRDANSFFVQDLMLVECLNADDFLLVLQEGQLRRKRAEHLLNVDSSRSHVLFTVYVEVSEGDRPARHGKITFVDLAGSERLQDTGNQADDSKFINRSLFALGNVVEKLSKSRTPNQRDHIPYRSSVLTQLLMDTLDGGCHTLLVACVTPSSRFVEESLRTIYFAQRARRIRSRPVERVDATQQEIYGLKAEIRRLQEENALFRRVLGLPQTGAVDPSRLQKLCQKSPRVTATSSPVPARAEKTSFPSGSNSLTRATQPREVACRNSNSEPVLRPTPLDILEQLPSSSELAARPRPLPLQGKPMQPSSSGAISARFGFHVVPKQNKLFFGM
ncbi:putative kinesin [Trypanosoma rangeli]|uniref:Kinesin-like protein n=1 Tax=Trypanosoma rangeli TaxID=5698 RepID=A0A3R7MC35_TRYRA|nr:putative kinesin [Trypanosoma rangeli]RNF03121.1 putative kinesin [Trypanosoma rangeli]|eukprot:RNF03121.1 putative kinesin [Trypanosoma rangeli]